MLSSYVAVTGCRPDEVEPSPIGEPETDSANPPPPGSSNDGVDDTGGADRQRVCAVYDGEEAKVHGATARYHCSGVARANLKAKIDITIDEVDPMLLDYIAEQGLDQQVNFGPNYGESFDDPAVIACCEHEYDYPNTPPPDDPEAEHGWACAIDCIDQTCRAIPNLLRDLAEDPDFRIHLKNNPFGCAVDARPCYYDELWSLSNYIAAHQQQCAAAFLHDQDPPYAHQVQGLGGTLDFDAWIAAHDPGADEAWPTLSGVVIEGTCGIDPPDGSSGSGWQLPPGPPQPCTNSNDNNDEEPFGSGHGGGFDGPDTFVASSGTIELEGPTLWGVDLGGTASIEAASSSACERERCAWASVGVDHQTFHLHDLHALAPQGLGWILHDLRLRTHGPRGAPLVADTTTSTFSFATGTLAAVASGTLGPLPLSFALRNTTPLRGTVTSAGPDAIAITLEPVTFGLDDRFGNAWRVTTTLGPWLAHQHAPRARFDIQLLDGEVILDATSSSDADGDPLHFAWSLDGMPAGEGRILRVPAGPKAIHVIGLHVRDSTGRDDRASRVLGIER